MSANQYARFLPEPWRTAAESIEPDATRWQWVPSPQSGSTAGTIDVHIARHVRPDAPVKVMLIHGAGGHSGLVWPLAAILADENCEVLAPDLPLYGTTRVEHPTRVRYTDWVHLLIDLVAAETVDDPRPLVLFGASMGGMLGYEVAHHSPSVSAVVATCLLDLAGDPDALHSAVRHDALARLAPLLPRLPQVLRNVRIPVTWFAPVARMSSDPALSRQCVEDPFGAASRLPLGFLADLTTHRPPAPERYAGPRILLVHPGSDEWTPPQVSLSFAHRITGRVDTELLTGCGHFPIEQPGIDELADHLRSLRDDMLRDDRR